ncbi:MAG: DUF92 domain-containing protein [Acidobacteria bacterium]|nr:DUF92 domain-containing protein [Acidobacteriota bacterium]NIM63739.1 DUF92 domain-containing protein [Acidobacteriota bacterium]NIO59308.1 DUF92 domain-containing protein [Acidobacteriota bacterium]NIQ30322.1 DUF92 domain-containing protein [Acidobacteriota bacterium]NIQ85259.1 DUF92 domain-containing protein [Acidobacteriota bacterium]
MSRLRGELMRKVVHISMGGFALLLRWITPAQAALLAIIALLFNLFVLHRLTRRALLREGERGSGYSRGIVLYPAAVLVLIVVFRDRMELAAAVWGFLAFGDGMATVAGVLAQGGKLPWNPQKSWAGFLAFVFNGTAAAAFLIRWTQLAGRDVTPAAESVSFSFLGVGGDAQEFVFLVSACFVAALAAAFAESLATGIDDNILVPLVGGGTLFAATLVQPALLGARADVLLTALGWGALVNALLAGLAYVLRSVSVSGAVGGWVLGTALFTFGGWRGFLMLFLFFALGTLATKLGYGRKLELGIAQEKGGRRGVKNALANTLTGVLFAFLAASTATPEIFTAALVAAFATAVCDTVSSETGQAYGRTHLLITNFRRVPPGTDGAVSLEGTLAGLAASASLAAIAWQVGLLTLPVAGIVAAAGFAGATIESYLGATVEKLDLLDNDLVNFANTMIGALIALVATRIVLGA